jgi:cholest-4-en-3-one 26-monooxygenase
VVIGVVFPRPGDIQRLEGRVREVVTELIDGFAARGSADFVQETRERAADADHPGARGRAREEQPAVLEFSTRFFGALDPEYEGGSQEVDALMRSIEAVAHRLAEERRHDPKDDMLSEL